MFFGTSLKEVKKKKGVSSSSKIFPENHMKIPDAGEILIQKAHCSPLSFDPQKQQLSGSLSETPSPRPIHVRFVNKADRLYFTKSTINFKEQFIWSETSKYHYYR